MKNLLIITAFFAAVLSSCNNNTKSDAVNAGLKDSTVSPLVDLTAVTDVKQLLAQNWENKEDAVDAALSAGGEGLEMPYRGFSFFADASVVENPRDKMRFGTWKLDDANKSIEIKYENGGKSQFEIVTISAKQLILLHKADQKKVEYSADGKVNKTNADNPFYAANNQWRIKPTSAETDEAIKLRTEQCMQFYAKFLIDNGNRGGNYSFVGLPTCFKWYKGGVSVTTAEKVDPKWFNCYYNKAQALKAHALLESILTKKYIWNKEETNWLKQTGDVAAQMYDTLRLL